MKIIYSIVILSFLAIRTCFSQDVRIIDKPGLIEILNNPSDKLHIINFWASWCGPCITELPEFKRVLLESDSSKVDFLFISLDFPSEIDKKLKPFLQKNNFPFEFALMNDTDYNSWIDIVDPGWQGNIPATLFYNNARSIHYFIPGPVDKEILIQTINSHLEN